MLKYEAILSFFQKIFCECPKCFHIFRLSEVEISQSKMPTLDWMNRLDSKIIALERKITLAEIAFEKKREKIIELERKRSESLTNRKIRAIVPNFSKIKFNTRDVKTIGYPVKFVSFDGRDQGATKKIRFIDFAPETKSQEKRFKELDSVIKKGNIDWMTLFITESGRIECAD